MTEMRTRQLQAVGSKPVDVLLVGFNSAHLLRRLRDTLQPSAAGRVALRLLVVDNASTARPLEILRRYFSCDVLIQNRALSRSTEVAWSLAALTKFGTRPSR
ncbi:hypothetical protein JJB11_03575 [Ramlibacter ginsenosidimutans]|uniref:Uncharacterized protein n=1 Tax=Ramlibacter ginsenosidimutans TaxID=502333 RepID=A0A934TQP7_9BURK|nr:hypothetical protein [Ramlibacter ginsenosidimutans]MBK6005161.1 hypothetical protein [Ramlibacter ginsenosidimutans]